MALKWKSNLKMQSYFYIYQDKVGRPNLGSDFRFQTKNFGVKIWNL
jgi:hypothetical protein